MANADGVTQRAQEGTARHSLWRRARTLVERAVFGAALPRLDSRDVRAYYRTTDG